MRDSGNIIVYVDDNGQPQVDVRFQDETVWLTQAQLVDLYKSSKANVSEHIKISLTRANLIKIQLFGNSEQFGPRATVRWDVNWNTIILT